MRYLVKGATSNLKKYIAIPTNRESRDIRHCRLFEVTEDTVEAMVDGIRRVFQLSPIDEVEIQYEGPWRDTEFNGRIEHPFLEHETFPAEASR